MNVVWLFLVVMLCCIVHGTIWHWVHTFSVSFMSTLLLIAELMCVLGIELGKQKKRGKRADKGHHHEWAVYLKDTSCRGRKGGWKLNLTELKRHDTMHFHCSVWTILVFNSLFLEPAVPFEAQNANLFCTNLPIILIVSGLFIAVSVYVLINVDKLYNVWLYYVNVSVKWLIEHIGEAEVTRPQFQIYNPVHNKSMVCSLSLTQNRNEHCVYLNLFKSKSVMLCFVSLYIRISVIVFITQIQYLCLTRPAMYVKVFSTPKLAISISFHHWWVVLFFFLSSH